LGKIDKYLYRELYLKSKGNVFKNKRVLTDYIHNAKIEYFLKKTKDDDQLLHHSKKISTIQKRILKFKEKMDTIYKDQDLL
jgi:large subunit ribosomal protein L19e